MFSDEQKRKIGSYISDIIIKHDSHGKYGAKKRFCGEFISKQGCGDIEIEYSRLIKMLEGNSAIQIKDLHIISEMYKKYGVSIEEILSAGKKKYVVPESNIRNYDIAASPNEALWDKYITKENNFITRSDEYGKTLVEYAVEFGNYDLIKYLLDKKIIWFVDESLPENELGFNGFCGGINKDFCSDRYSDINHALKYNDHLRTRTIALAIEKNDISMFDLLHARSSPELYSINENGAPGNETKHFSEERCEELINALSLSDNAEIIKYFSDEFSLISVHASSNKFVFPYMNDLLCSLINAKRYEIAEIYLKKAINHNKYVYDMMNSVINEEVVKSMAYHKERIKNLMEEANNNGVADKVNIECKSEYNIREIVRKSFRYDCVSHTVSYFSNVRNHYVSNIVYVKNKKGSDIIKKLVDELNTWYRKTVELGGEKYAEVLLQL